MNTNQNQTESYINSLSFLGWNGHFQNSFNNHSKETLIPARVAGVHKNSFLVHTGTKEELVTVAGRFNYKTDRPYPVIGDWVLVADKVICDILPRRNVLSRAESGTHGTKEMQAQKGQVMAANLDTIFIVSGTDRDFNLRRIERYLTLVYNCGLTPVIVLTKADLHETPEWFLDEVEQVAFGVPVYLISANETDGVKALEKYISQGQTISMIGSSGAGKSTLVNRLYGKAVQTTNTVSDTIGKGRHTTTNRSLILMPQGGMVIDNPGIREIGLWDDGQGLEAVFPEIEQLALNCRFNDCSHTHEPGCRVLQAIGTGEIRQDRYNSYLKMKRELSYLADRQQKSADRIEKERWKGVALKIKAMKKGRK